MAAPEGCITAGKESVRRLLLMADRPLGLMCLERMAAVGLAPCGVVSRRDADEQWWGQPVFEAKCHEMGIPWFDHNAPLSETLIKAQADFLVSVLFTRIVPSAVLQRTPGVNLHCAPLPSHAGFNASLWAILDRDRSFGATLHVLTEHVDAGPIVDEERFRIAADITNAELYALAHRSGLRLFERALGTLAGGPIRSTPQRGRQRYHRRELPPRVVARSWPAEKISRYARAFFCPPFEPAFLLCGDRKVHLVPEMRHLGPQELRVWGLGAGPIL
jgi:methionyl-tRNA formyltransferase